MTKGPATISQIFNNLSTSVSTIVPNAEGLEQSTRKYQQCGDVYTKFAIVLGIIIVILGLVAAFGNALTCLVIVKNKEFHSVTNALLLSLGLSDLLVSCVLLPFDVGHYFTYEQPMYIYSPLCVVIYNGIYFTLTSLSIMNLLLVSIDRFISIRYPFSLYVTSSKRTMKIALACVWLYCLMFFISMLFVQEWPKEGTFDYSLPRWYEWLFLFLNWILPTLMNVLIYLYILMTVVSQRKTIKSLSIRQERIELIHQSRSTRTTVEQLVTVSLVPSQMQSLKISPYQQQEALSTTTNRKSSSTTKRGQRLFLWIVITFLVFWLPHFSYQIYLMLKTDYIYTCMGDCIESLLLSMTYVNNTVNVFVYGGSSNMFRKAYKKLFLSICKLNAN